MERYNEVLGQRIRNLREDRDLTQKKLSSMLGLTPKMISSYENNQRTPPIDVLVNLAKIFSVSADYLLGIDTPTQLPKKLLTWERVIVSFPNATILQNEDKDIIEYYQQLSLQDKRWIMGQMIDLIKKAEEQKSGVPKAQ